MPEQPESDLPAREMAMLIRALCHRLRRHEPDAAIIAKAERYLDERGLGGGVLREGFDPNTLSPEDRYAYDIGRALGSFNRLRDA